LDIAALLLDEVDAALLVALELSVVLPVLVRVPVLVVDCPVAVRVPDDVPEVADVKVPEVPEEPELEPTNAAHSWAWSWFAADTSAAVQFACRQESAACWKGNEVHTHGRSAKLEQPELEFAAACIEHWITQASSPDVDEGAGADAVPVAEPAVPVTVLCAATVKTAAARKRRDLVVKYIS